MASDHRRIARKLCEQFELLSRNPMGAPVFATPAVAGTTLIVRTVSDVFGITG
jgi:hypothetical protein